MTVPFLLEKRDPGVRSLCGKPRLYPPLQDGAGFHCASSAFLVNKLSAHVQEYFRAKSLPVLGHSNEVMSKQPIRCVHVTPRGIQTASMLGSGSPSTKSVSKAWLQKDPKCAALFLLARR